MSWVRVTRLGAISACLLLGWSTKSWRQRTQFIIFGKKTLRQSCVMQRGGGCFFCTFRTWLQFVIEFWLFAQKQGESASFGDVAKYPIEKLRDSANLPDGIDVLHKEVRKEQRWTGNCFCFVNVRCALSRQEDRLTVFRQDAIYATVQAVCGDEKRWNLCCLSSWGFTFNNTQQVRRLIACGLFNYWVFTNPTHIFFTEILDGCGLQEALQDELCGFCLQAAVETDADQEGCWPFLNSMQHNIPTSCLTKPVSGYLFSPALFLYSAWGKDSLSCV